MDRGKKPVTTDSASDMFENIDWKYYEQKEKKDKRRREAEEQAKKQKIYEKNIFIRKMRRMKNKEDKKDKDWVLTKEEYNNYGLCNIKILEAVSSERDKITAALNDGKISEEEWRAQLKKMYEYYDKKEQELEDVEEAEIARYVEAHEAREHQIATKVEESKKREDEVDNEYVVDLSAF